MMLSSALPLASDYRHRSPWGVWSVYLSACCRREHEESWSRLNAVFTRNGSLLCADNVVTILLMHIILFDADKPDQVRGKTFLKNLRYRNILLHCILVLGGEAQDRLHPEAVHLLAGEIPRLHLHQAERGRDVLGAGGHFPC